MLSIVKINAASHQSASRRRAGYSHYLGEPSTRKTGDFDAYARGDGLGPRAFWTGKGAALLGLSGEAEAEHVERLAKGLHPVTGAPLVKGAGDGHVQGLDMTFSAPKDFSILFAGADASTQAALIEALQESAKAAMAYAESGAVTRRGKAGLRKELAAGTVSAVFTHLSSRAGDPHGHCHALLLNVAKRAGSDEWSAMELRTQFDRKMATGILMRAELASRLADMGFAVRAVGPYFEIDGITDAQREAMSKRSREIAKYMRESGLRGLEGSAARDIAALNSRAAKAEPPLPEMLRGFAARAQELGVDHASVAAMRTANARETVALDFGEILKELVSEKSCATEAEALALICEKGMGRLSAAQCQEQLGLLMMDPRVRRLGATELRAEVFTTAATRELEAEIDARVAAGKRAARHRISRRAVGAQFDALESELREKLGVEVTLAQQREAAAAIACEPGDHALCVGWAGAGKTTLLKATRAAWAASGLDVQGCCQSAAAAQNLAREAGIPSRTIASLMLALRDGRARLGSKTVLVLDEAGMVGSREFAELQKAVVAAGAKLVCVGDPKQLQPIEAGGIFGSLARRHGAAEVSLIQRQRTDFEPMLAWLESRTLDKGKAAALRALPEDARGPALEAVCAGDAKLSRALARWKARFDYRWLREAVEHLAKGEAAEALAALDERGLLLLKASPESALDSACDAWLRDKTALPSKIMVAATRAEVEALNLKARASLVEVGLVNDLAAIDRRVEMRDGALADRRFGAGDRVVFTRNDARLGVANGVAGTVRAIEGRGARAEIVVDLDAANPKGETEIRVHPSFAWLDLAYCRTVHRSQGLTLDSVHVLTGAHLDREWAYVACSRSRFSTTLHVDASALGLVDPEAHREGPEGTRARVVDALASRMGRSKSKGTSLDWEAEPSPEIVAAMARGWIERIRGFAAELAR